MINGCVQTLGYLHTDLPWEPQPWVLVPQTTLPTNIPVWPPYSHPVPCPTCGSCPTCGARPFPVPQPLFWYQTS